MRSIPVRHSPGQKLFQCLAVQGRPANCFHLLSFPLPFIRCQPGIHLRYSEYDVKKVFGKPALIFLMKFGMD
jgi:hypothetical protein